MKQALLPLLAAVSVGAVLVGATAAPSLGTTTSGSGVSVTVENPVVALGQIMVVDTSISCSAMGGKVSVRIEPPVNDTTGVSCSGSSHTFSRTYDAPMPDTAMSVSMGVWVDSSLNGVPTGGELKPIPVSIVTPTLTLNLGTTSPVVGDTVTASGTLSPCLNADTPVAIQQQRGTAWVTVASSTIPGCVMGTASYTASFVATQGGAVRAVIAPTDPADAAASSPVSLSPRTLVAPPGPIATSMAARLAQRRVHPGARVRVIGWVMPCSRGPVRLERRAGRRWKTIATRTVVCAGDTSPASFTLRTRAPARGTWRLRASYDGHTARLPRLHVVPLARPVPKVVHVVLPPAPAPVTTPPPPPPPPAV